MSKNKRKYNSDIGHTIIADYIGYILPVLCTAAMLMLVFIPSMHFTDGEGNVKSTLSVGTLANNAWDTVRHFLSSSSDIQDKASTDFSKYIQAALIVSALCFLIGSAAQLCTMIAGLRRIGGKTAPGKNDKFGNLLITFIPNRAVMFLLGALTVVPFAFPRILLYAYRKILYTDISLSYHFGDLAIYAAVLWVIPILFILFTKKKMTRDNDVFARQRVSWKDEDKVEDDEDDEDD